MRDFLKSVVTHVKFQVNGSEELLKSFFFFLMYYDNKKENDKRNKSEKPVSMCVCVRVDNKASHRWIEIWPVRHRPAKFPPMCGHPCLAEANH